MNATDIRSTIAARLADAERAAAAVVATRPDIVNGRSDGRRVKYVRAATTAETLRAILALLDAS